MFHSILRVIVSLPLSDFPPFYISHQYFPSDVASRLLHVQGDRDWALSIPFQTPVNRDESLPRFPGSSSWGWRSRHEHQTGWAQDARGRWSTPGQAHRTRGRDGPGIHWQGLLYSWPASGKTGNSRSTEPGCHLPEFGASGRPVLLQESNR